MPLQAYLDDSGTHNDSPVCLAAGYFGGAHYWKNFGLDWNRAVKKRGLEEFHASRFWSGGVGGKTSGEYANWNRADCEGFLDELLGIIHRYRIWPVGSAVVLSEWNALTFDERRHLTGGVYRGGQYKSGGAPSKEYFVAFLFAVQNVAAYCGVGHVVDFMVDESRDLNGYAQEYFARIKTSKFAHAGKLGTIRSGESKAEPGLQAADLLAYLALKRTRDNPDLNLKVESDSPLGRAAAKARDLSRDFKLLGKIAFDRLLTDFRNEIAAAPSEERHP